MNENFDAVVDETKEKVGKVTTSRIYLISRLIYVLSTVGLIVAKAAGYLLIPWWIVFSPIWVPFLFGLVPLLFIGIIFFVLLIIGAIAFVVELILEK